MREEMRPERPVGVVSGFKNFLMQGDIIIIAIGLVIALAFSTLIKAFTDNIMSPERAGPNRGDHPPRSELTQGSFLNTGPAECVGSRPVKRWPSWKTSPPWWRPVASVVVLATLVALAGCGGSSRVVRTQRTTQRTSAALYYAHHAGDAQARGCLPVKYRKPTVLVRCMMGRVKGIG
jgi:hypothetical protein